MTYGQNAAHQRLRTSRTSPVEVELSWYGVTDIGKRRNNNQDSYVVQPPLFAVADGMGGHAAGEVASAAVAKRLSDLALASHNDSPESVIEPETVTGALTIATKDMELRAIDPTQGTGTTVTGVALVDHDGAPHWLVFNVGDSRVYLFSEGRLTQVTVDHSVVQHLIDTGQISIEEAEFHPQANVITRAVGTGEDPTPDFLLLPCLPDQRLLICSDGLTKELTDVGIQYFLSTGETAEESALQLMEHALGNAGRDNVTVVVINVDSVEENSAEAQGATPN